MKTLFTLLLLGLILQAKSQGFNEPKIEISAKNPATAFASSLLIPGLGQMYNEQVEKGLILFGTEITLAYFTAKITSDPDYTDGSKVAMIGLTGLVYLYQLIDAPLVSDKINRLNKSKSYQNKWTIFESRSSIGLAYRF